MTNQEDEKLDSISFDSNLPSLPTKVPEYCASLNYYKEYWQIYLENERLLSVLQQSQNDCVNLQKKINSIQVNNVLNIGILQYVCAPSSSRKEEAYKTLC